MSGRASRRKGKAGELEVVAELARHGIMVRRTPNSGGLAWRGDLQGLEGFVFEVKRQETLAVPAWLRQAHAASRAGEVPVVIFRRSGRGNTSQPAPDTFWHVIEPLDSWAARVALVMDSEPGDDWRPPARRWRRSWRPDGLELAGGGELEGRGGG